MIDRLLSGLGLIVTAVMIHAYIDYIVKRNQDVSATTSDLYSAPLPKRLFLTRLYAYRKFRRGFRIMCLVLLLGGVGNLVLAVLIGMGITVD